MDWFRRNSDAVRISAYALTDVGRTRQHNEDRFLVADLSTQFKGSDNRAYEYTLGPKGSLLMVADGMGGAAAGEVASQMATEVVYEHLVLRWAPRSDGDLGEFQALIHDAVLEANSRIHDEACRREGLGGMGTTATIIGILGGSCVVTQVGDSRAYRIRNGQATQLSRDQSIRQHLVDTGRATAEEAGEMSNENVILQALGPRTHVGVVQSTESLADHDVLLLCSDGLSGLLKTHEISQIVREDRDLKRVSRRLVNTANERGGPDNITVVVARCSGKGLPELEKWRDAGGTERSSGV